MCAAIVGWAHTPFGKHDAETVESLVVRVARDALDHAGIGPHDVDEIVLGARFQSRSTLAAALRRDAAARA